VLFVKQPKLLGLSKAILKEGINSGMDYWNGILDCTTGMFLIV